jgi:hypothetical protein
VEPSTAIRSLRPPLVEIEAISNSNNNNHKNNIYCLGTLEAKIRLHPPADLINRGVALRHDFRDAFPGETDDDLSEVREEVSGESL